VSNASMSARDARHVFGPDSEPTEMEMRVAEAIKSVDYSKSAGGLGTTYLSLARAAIRAMREATTEMLREAGMVVAGNTEAHATVWETMIDAASPGDET
jgi:hypothetical protein